MKFSSFFAFLMLMLIAFSGSSVMAKTASMGKYIGEVIAAETSTLPMEITELNKSPYKHNYQTPRYVLLVVKMHPRRSLSSVDYTLSINGVSANCIAAVCNMEPFVTNPAVLFPGNDDLVRMLFIFDGSRVKGNGKTLTATLKAVLNGRQSVQLNITDIGNAQFTDLKNIPADGILK